MSSFPGERCQHIKLSGDRCGAPALRDQKFCRFHDCCGLVEVDVSVSAAYPACPFYLPVLEDAASIQYTINQVCQHLLHHRLDAKKAGVMLYAMQIAASNLDRLSEGESRKKSRENTSDANNPENTDGENTDLENNDREKGDRVPSNRMNSALVHNGRKNIVEALSPTPPSSEAPAHSAPISSGGSDH